MKSMLINTIGDTVVMILLGVFTLLDLVSPSFAGIFLIVYWTIEVTVQVVFYIKNKKSL